LSRLDEAPSAAAGSERPLVDLPLRSEDAGTSFRAVAADAVEKIDSVQAAAGLGPRAGAFVADAATILLVWAAALLAAAALRGETPGPAALPWAAAFALLLSFFATVPALVLFGRTVGMAVAGLVARAGPPGRRLTSDEAVRRWLGTLATAASLGVVLLWTAWSPEAPTPADRLSRRPLAEEESRVEG
jgi:hypothetical protein